ncbi:hypothetical protein [Halorubrum aethiopicum]|uniref:hypothetical protein n=1 Tax=Halorubrum aethiopicum TaxID=1758255 RepID=UPI00082AD894|nr:hypothetical protein [Halorubrum aethiopicum]
MDRAVPFATAFLVGVCVFAWLAGPILEARFGAEALLVAYGGVAVGAAGTVYVLVRRLDARLGGGGAAATRNESDANVGGDDGEPADGDGGSSADRDAGGDDRAGRAAGSGDAHGTDRAGDAVSASLDELDALDVEREVRELKAERLDAERESSRDERE